MKQLITILIVVIVTAAVAGGIVYKFAGDKIDARVTIESIRKVAHLATVEYHLAALMDKTYKSSILVKKVDSSRMIAYYTGKVKGSVDLEKIEVQTSQTPEGGQVLIHFKRGSILVSGVEILPGEDSVKEITCYVRKAFNPPTDNQRERLREAALKIIRQKAIEQGIVQKTMENTKTVLSEFVDALGLHATIDFDEKAYDPETT